MSQKLEKELMNENINRHRRSLLAGMTTLVGGSMASQLLDRKGFLVATAYARNESEGAANIFSSRQILVLEQICQTVIPPTDTPGAGDVDAHGFIDNQLRHCFGADIQASIMKLISNIDKRAVDKFEQGFVELSSNNATELLTAIDLGRDDSEEIKTSDFKFLKYLIVFGYYTTEIGASKELRYDPVPGGFKANVPLQEVGSAWGSLAFF